MIQGQTSKPASQRYKKEARKHVMRDIGFMRRKENIAEVPGDPKPDRPGANVDDGVVQEHVCTGKKTR